MTEAVEEVPTFTDEERKILALWRQGDFTLDRAVFPVVAGDSGKEVEVDLYPTEGWVIVSQTCDIVNIGKGKEFVTICPLVAATPALLAQIANGTTPAAASLELSVREDLVVDLGRMASLHKRALTGLTRRDGFASDHKRSVFAESLERRFGRFAFPDELSAGPLRYLRNRAKQKHGADSPIGKVYRAIDQIRIRATPGFYSGASFAFHVVVDGEKEKVVGRKAIRDELEAVAKHSKFAWPEGYRKENDFFVVQTTEEMSAREWIESYPVDLDFISDSS
ncbi:hypothetical protein SAMCCGM7_pB0105 (plasmid) [Sinorhizobium americanum CCGM7]|uniref:hypothetical protein n=1 Tax=Sinorhizobium americanum TaxID=194963 RepID=UPI0004D7114F|nr:hypothetical protein [Sinorhizobium americanum]APG86821.1 hypothetical protein SAMCCGM7_pB0105 [Sinorhizobium americanum CCGM7]